MSRRKSSGRPKRVRGVKTNMVAAAVELAGGVTAVAKLCGVARQSVYTWIEEWRIERLIDALKTGAGIGNPDRPAGQGTPSSRRKFRLQNQLRRPTSPTRSLNKRSRVGLLRSVVVFDVFAPDGSDQSLDEKHATGVCWVRFDLINLKYSKVR